MPLPRSACAHSQENAWHHDAATDGQLRGMRTRRGGESDSMISDGLTTSEEEEEEKYSTPSRLRDGPYVGPANGYTRTRARFPAVLGR